MTHGILVGATLTPTLTDRYIGLGKPREGAADDGDRVDGLRRDPPRTTRWHSYLVTDAAPWAGVAADLGGPRRGSRTMRPVAVTTAERFHAAGEEPAARHRCREEKRRGRCVRARWHGGRQSNDSLDRFTPIRKTWWIPRVLTDWGNVNNRGSTGIIRELTTRAWTRVRSKHVRIPFTTFENIAGREKRSCRIEEQSLDLSAGRGQ